MNVVARKEFYSKIKKELLELPGEMAHLDMLPFRKGASEVHSKGIDYRLSAVLILLYVKDGEPHFILTERQQYKGKHSGQISLPGGKTEPFDSDTNATALRETEEEIGIPALAVKTLGRLTEVYVPPSNFLIHPYIGFIDVEPVIRPDEREVKTVMHCSIMELMKEENRIITAIKMNTGMNLKNIPAFNFQNKIVWGATAVILNEFKFILKRFLD